MPPVLRFSKVMYFPILEKIAANAIRTRRKRSRPAWRWIRNRAGRPGANRGRRWLRANRMRACLSKRFVTPIRNFGCRRRANFPPKRLRRSKVDRDGRCRSRVAAPSGRGECGALVVVQSARAARGSVRSGCRCFTESDRRVRARETSRTRACAFARGGSAHVDSARVF